MTTQVKVDYDNKSWILAFIAVRGAFTTNGKI